MADWQAIRNEYEAGASLRQLAAKYGVGKSTIARHKHAEQWIESLLQERDSGGTVVQWDTPQAQSNEDVTPLRDLTTAERKLLFLDDFALHGIVTPAAKAAGIHRKTVYDWLENDEEFSFAFNQAKEAAKDAIRAEIHRRGAEGYEEQILQGGKIYTVRKYSDTLLAFHAKMLMPEYREKQQIDVNTHTSAVEIYKIRIPENGRDT